MKLKIHPHFGNDVWWGMVLLVACYIAVALNEEREYYITITRYWSQAKVTKDNTQYKMH